MTVFILPNTHTLIYLPLCSLRSLYRLGHINHQNDRKTAKQCYLTYIHCKYYCVFRYQHSRETGKTFNEMLQVSAI